MIGYNKNELMSKISLLDELPAPLAPHITVARATFYSMLAGSVDNRVYDREMFTFLFMMHMLSRRNTYKHASSKFSEIFTNETIHELNRALYDQRSRVSMLKQDGLVPAFISDAIKRVGKDDFVGALSNIALYYNIDIDKFLIDSDRIKKMIRDNKIYKQKVTDFGEMCYGSDNNWA